MKAALLRSIILMTALLGCSVNSETPDQTQQTIDTQNQAPVPPEAVRFLKAVPVRESSLPRNLVASAPRGEKEVFKTSRNCDSLSFSERTIQRNWTSSELLTKLFSCQAEWDLGTTGVSSLISVGTSKYEFEKNRNITYLKMQLANGKFIRGLLALKPDLKPRPLVIAACGVMCDAGDYLTQYMLMQLFDSTPFHVLVIGNSTSLNYIEDNGVGGFGGLDGGDTLLRLARYFSRKDISLSPRIDTVHVFGLSLGSHEALYAAALNHRFGLYSGERPIRSFATTCTVADYPETVRLLMERKLLGFLANKIFDDYTVLLERSVPGYLADLSKTPFEQNLDLFYASQKQIREKFGLTEPWQLPPAQSQKELITQSHVSYIRDNLTDPILSLSSANDVVVNADLNTRALLSLARPNLSVALMPKGNHCANAFVYGWRNISKVFESFYLSHSPDFVSALKRKHFALPKDFARRVKSEMKNSPRMRVEWEISKNDEYAKLYFFFERTDSARPSHCRIDLNPFPKNCARPVSVKIPLSELPEFFEIPKSTPEAQSLERWLNVQVKLVDTAGENIESSGAAPVAFEYWEL